jgi:GT2 family glycosyltransferase
MEATKVSVLIITWERKDLLINLIESLENQSVDKGVYEICICDSGSNDGTDEAIKLLSHKYSNIKYYDIETNTAAAKRNYLLRQTVSPIIIALDDDLLLGNDFIQSYIEAHKNTYNTLFCGQVRFPLEWVKVSNYYHYRDSKHIKEGMSGINLNDLPAKNIVTMNMSFKREEFITFDYMNENFIKYGFEDIEFGIRAKQNDIKIVYLSRALVYHLENSEIDGYLNKLYVTARYGYKKLLSIHPNFELNSSINLLMSLKKTDKFHILLKKAFLNFFLNDYTLCIVKRYLKITDHNSFFYSYNLYNFICACSIKKGINDQLKINDNNNWL